MQFLHVYERRDLLKEHHFDKPEKVDYWLNAELVKAVFHKDGICGVRTKRAMYLVDGFCSEMEDLFRADFEFHGTQKGVNHD